MLYQQIARNKRKTAFLLVIFVIILALVGGGLGYLINGEPFSGIAIALIGSLIYLFIVLQNPGNLVTESCRPLEPGRHFGFAGSRPGNDRQPPKRAGIRSGALLETGPPSGSPPVGAGHRAWKLGVECIRRCMLA